MKIPKKYSRIVWASLLLAASVGSSQATEIILNQFNSAAEVSAFAYNNWNGSPGSVTFDATKDANGNPASGSMKMQITYQASGSNGCAFISSAAPMPVRLANVSAVEFDLLVDVASPLDKNGNAFYFQIGFNSPSFSKYSEFWFGPWGQNFTAGVWKHFSNSVPVGTFSSTNFLGQLFMNPFDDQYTNAKTPIVYIDNIQFHEETFPDFDAFTFDNTNYLTGYNPWYAGNSVVIHATNDFYGNTNSGSALVTTTHTPNGGTATWWLAFDTNGFNINPPNITIDGYQFDGVQMDIMWDNTSSIGLSNFNFIGDNYGFPLGIVEGPSTGNNYAAALPSSVDPSLPDAATNGWVRMFFPLNPAASGISDIVGIGSKKYDGSGTIGGTAGYFIDNVKFLGKITSIARPTISFSKPVPGLQQVSTGTGGNPPYDREMLLTLITTATFVDQPDPVTYTFNIQSFPPAPYNFLALLSLVPNAAFIGGGGDVADYHEPTLFAAELSRNGAGTRVTLRAKTNTPTAGNGAYYDGSNPTWTNASPIEGKWMFTFTQNTNILVRAPNGSSTNMVFPLGLSATDVSTIFGPNMIACFESYNNGGGNVGQRVVYGNAGITNGSTTVLWDNFLLDAVLDTSLWINGSMAGVPAAGIFIIPADTTLRYYVDWTLPAVGFELQTNSVVSGGSWAPIGLPAVQIGDHVHVEVDQTNLTSGSLYFRLRHP